MTRHPLASVATCEDSLDVHPSTIYKVTNAGAKHDGKDEISIISHKDEHQEERHENLNAIERGAQNAREKWNRRTV